MDEEISFGSRQNWNRTPMAARHRVRRYLLWFLYNSLEHLDQPFSLEELAESIKKESGVKPKASSILKAVAAYYEESQTPLIYRVCYRDETPLYAFDLTMYGLNHNPFLPPLDRKGRRRKKYINGGQSDWTGAFGSKNDPDPPIQENPGRPGFYRKLLQDID